MYEAVVWVAFVLSLISFFLILIVGIWFFVERTNFINSNVSYNIYQTGSSSEFPHLGNTYLMVNTSGNVSIKLKSSSHNKKGQQLFIASQLTSGESAVTIMTDGITISNAPNNPITLPSRHMLTFIFTEQNQLLYTGMTKV